MFQFPVEIFEDALLWGVEDGRHFDVEIDVILVSVKKGMGGWDGLLGEEGGSEDGRGGCNRSDVHDPPICFR